MPLAYAYDVDIISRSKREVCAVFCKIVKEARAVGIQVNEDKKKYFLSTIKDSTLGESTEIKNYNF